MLAGGLSFATTAAGLDDQISGLNFSLAAWKDDKPAAFIICSDDSMVRSIKSQWKLENPDVPYDGFYTLGKTYDIQAIMDFLPHRYPFLMVDRIIELEVKKRIVGIKNVTITEQFFSGHFPGRPIMPGVLIIEAMAQTAGILMLREAENQCKYPYFMSINDVKFRRPVGPGDQLRLETEVIRLRSNTCLMQGRALVDGNLVAEAKLMCSLVDEQQ